MTIERLSSIEAVVVVVAAEPCLGALAGRLLHLR